MQPREGVLDLLVFTLRALFLLEEGDELIDGGRSKHACDF